MILDQVDFLFFFRLDTPNDPKSSRPLDLRFCSEESRTWQLAGPPLRPKSGPNDNWLPPSRIFHDVSWCFMMFHDVSIFPDPSENDHFSPPETELPAAVATLAPLRPWRLLQCASRAQSGPSGGQRTQEDKRWKRPTKPSFYHFCHESPCG